MSSWCQHGKYTDHYFDLPCGHTQWCFGPGIAITGSTICPLPHDEEDDDE